MFDLDRQLSPGNPAGIVATLQAKQSVEARQRDIYESHRHRTFSLAFYMTGNELEAEQILTDTFIQAFQTRQEPGAYDVDSALVHQLRQRFLLESTLIASTPSALDACLDGRNVKRTDLEEAIQILPPAQRLLFLLRDVEGYTPAKIAELLKISEQQVQRNLLAARIRLRQALAQGQARSEAA